MSTGPLNAFSVFDPADVGALTSRQRTLLIADIDFLAEELARTPSDLFDRAWAGLELCKRIGGTHNLLAYARVLETQARREEEE